MLVDVPSVKAVLVVVMITPFNQVAVFRPHSWNIVPIGKTTPDTFGNPVLLTVRVSSPPVEEGATCTLEMFAAAIPMNCCIFWVFEVGEVAPVNRYVVMNG
jgi:hypothetical protein